MKSFLIVIALVTAPAFAADWPSEMPESCSQELIKHPDIREGNFTMQSQDIIAELKFDWKSNPENSSAVYDECGASSFYYVVVDKASCKVVKSDFGDSDGECD